MYGWSTQIGWTLTKAGANICLQEMAPPQTQKIWRAVWGTNLFVRVRPERESEKCSELTPGARVVELERQGEWIRYGHHPTMYLPRIE
jgi:hypothetical protein